MHHARKLPVSAIILTVAILYFAKTVLVPLALAVLFSFLLSPLLRRLERWKIPRLIAVLLTALACLGVFGGIGWLTATQVNDLAAKIPAYQGNIQSKLDALRGKGGSLQQAADVLTKMNQRADHAANAALKPGEDPQPASAADRKAGGPEQPPLAVRIVEPPASPPLVLRRFFGPLLAPLGTLGLVIIFTIFILIAHENLRDRLVHLTGPAHLPLTTQAMDEAGSRVSGYLQAQVAVNFTLGCGVATGLYFIGVPNAALWGLLTALFRFVPYVGFWASALAPLALSLAAFQSWWPVALTAALYVTLEVIVSNALEPWLYGARTGLAPVAVIISATFWTWLWGTEGLFLSTPLTVCIVVLGRYVPQLDFLHTLLGDEPVMPLDTRLYQRLLASDQEEVAELVETCFTTQTCAELYDGVMIPALNRTQLDVQRGRLDADRERAIHQTLRTLAEDLSERPVTGLKNETAEEAAGGKLPPTTPSPTAPAGPLPVRVLILPVKTDADEIAGLLLKHLLTTAGTGSEVLSSKSLVNEMTAIVSERQVPIVCLSATRPFPVVQARHLAKRLRAAVPGVKLLIGLWDAKKTAESAHRNLESVNVDGVVSTLAGAVEQICQIVPCVSTISASVSQAEALQISIPGELVPA